MPDRFQRPLSWRDSLRAVLIGLTAGLIVARVWPRDVTPGRPVAALGTYVLVSGIAFQLTVTSGRPLAERLGFTVLISIVGTLLYGLMLSRL